MFEVNNDLINGFGYVGKYICLYSINEDETESSSILIDCTFPKCEVEDRLTALCHPPFVESCNR